MGILACHADRAAAANERKAAQAADKASQKAAQMERTEAEQWSQGAKGASKKKQDDEAKRQEALARKKEREAMLAAEEAKLPAAKKAEKPAPLVKGAAKAAAARTAKVESFQAANKPVESFGASGIDDALALLDIVGKPKAATGGSQDALDRHPERRVKAAYAQWEETAMAALKAEQPGLRLSQYKQLLAKQWKKAPENPLNQAHISYDTKRDEARDLVARQKSEVLDRLRT
ncbi:hypothetical protein CXG81DRAFT_10857 [Caulochytrium protostelioides]|uniref:DUF1014-domain-containing protein n=1 Tax=Caulochytrium protostelioides TaxID=1555241 RepID=A0A4P9XBA4_9FUNG|nr:hypothetical protein CXG81DRAFT_10857 [Caulochytrium protostelioides]|eukprot:RKP02371.1 hypothetical protein CXG81DRAFT_10857 [Caulochytrium protostelioides]